MAHASAALARPDAAREIAAEVLAAADCVELTRNNRVNSTESGGTRR